MKWEPSLGSFFVVNYLTDNLSEYFDVSKLKLELLDLSYLTLCTKNLW